MLGIIMSNNLKYIDIHGHVNFPDYDTDRAEVIARAKDSGVGMITIGTDIASSKKAIELAEDNENMWAIVGIHPTDAHTLVGDDNLKVLAKLAAHPKVVAIGECGLDYFHGKAEDMAKQREIFLWHIELANTLKKPLMLHVRNAKVNKDVGASSGAGELAGNAYQEVITILKEKSKVRANFHFFAGSIEDARDIIAMGNTISFTGVLTFAFNYNDIVREMPLENIMSETDCPFVAPVPYRGKRNEPSYVIETVKKIAEIRKEDVNVVAKQLLVNAQKFFGLTKVEPMS